MFCELVTELTGLKSRTWCHFDSYVCCCRFLFQFQRFFVGLIVGFFPPRNLALCKIQFDLETVINSSRWIWHHDVFMILCFVCLFFFFEVTTYWRAKSYKNYQSYSYSKLQEWTRPCTLNPRGRSSWRLVNMTGKNETMVNALLPSRSLLDMDSNVMNIFY